MALLAETPAVSTEQVQDWYRPGPLMREFHASRVRVRVLLGGRGSGKTTGVACEVLGHCFHNAGAKAYILRKTQDSNQDTTLDTFEQVFGLSGSGYEDTGISLFKKIEGGKKFRLPSRIAVELFNKFKQNNPRATKAQTIVWLETMGGKYCSWVEFAGVPSGNYRATRFRGFECSMLVFVEADQLDKEDLDLGVACLRWKGQDPKACDSKGFIRDTCIILDTNPPSPSHWIAQMEAEATESKDTTRKFWHIPTEENRHNLPDNYVEDLQKQYARNPAMYSRMLLGEYADAFSGNPVFYSFSQEQAHPRLDFPAGAYLIRGWDFGTTHAVVWSAYWVVDGDEYWWDLMEYFAEQSDVDRQCKTVIDTTAKVFPFFNDRSVCQGVRDYCDIAGKQRKDTGSSIQTLQSYKIYPGSSRMGLRDSISVYNRLLAKRDKHGKLIYRIDRNACPMLYRASFGGYRYPQVGEPGYGSDEPLKGPSGGNYDHIADASRYAKANCMRLLGVGNEAVNAAVGRLAAKPAPNARRRWY